MYLSQGGYAPSRTLYVSQGGYNSGASHYPHAGIVYSAMAMPVYMEPAYVQAAEQYRSLRIGCVQIAVPCNSEQEHEHDEEDIGQHHHRQHSPPRPLHIEPSPNDLARP